MKYLPHLALCWLLLLPYQAWSAVIISEIAWMGSTESAHYEWIELHNTGGAAVDLAAWQLRDANTLTIDLAGTIPAGDYVVIERNRGSEAYLFTPPFLVYTGALVNSGTTLTLYDAEGTIADQVAGGENWDSIGGDNATKETAQYSSAGWITATPTPGSATVAPTSAESGAAATNAVTTPQSAQHSPTTGSSGTVLTSTRDSHSLERASSRLVLQIDAPTTAYVGQPVTLAASASGVPKVIADSLKHQWNFGDSYNAVQGEVEHVYEFPGQYVVTLESGYATHDAAARHLITVLPIKVSLAVSPDGDILVHNDAPYEIDISGYRLVGDERVVFPAQSYMLPNSTITVAQSRVHTTATSVVALYDQAGRLVEHTAFESSVATTSPLVVAQTRVPTTRTVTTAAAPLAQPTTPTTHDDSNFTFATADTSVASSPPPATLESATITPALAITQDRRRTTTTGAATAGSATSLLSDWWTTGGLILLLSGTILGLWWQRRLI